MGTSEHDQQIFKQMIHSIDVFENQDGDLVKIIGSLETLFESLKHVPNEWRDAFLSKWSILEDIYAFALDEEQTQLESEDTQSITEALQEIRHLTQAAIEGSFK